MQWILIQGDPRVNSRGRSHLLVEPTSGYCGGLDNKSGVHVNGEFNERSLIREEVSSRFGARHRADCKQGR